MSAPVFPDPGLTKLDGGAIGCDACGAMTDNESYNFLVPPGWTVPTIAIFCGGDCKELLFERGWHNPTRLQALATLERRRRNPGRSREDRDSGKLIVWFAQQVIDGWAGLMADIAAKSGVTPEVAERIIEEGAASKWQDRPGMCDRCGGLPKWDESSGRVYVEHADGCPEGR